MKFLFFITIFLSNLFSENWNVSCKGELQNINIKDLPYTFGMEYEGDLAPLYGELETSNYSMPFYDDSSPACGGNGSSNKLVFVNGTGYTNSYSFDLHDANGYGIHRYNSDAGVFENATTFVNNIPCMPINSTSMTVGVYDWNNNTNLGLTTAYDLINVFEVVESPLTTDEIALLQSICPDPDAVNSRDYTPLLTQISDNTLPISQAVDKLTNLNDKADVRNDFLNDITSLLTNIDNTLSNTDNSDNGNTDNGNNSNTPTVEFNSPLTDIDNDLSNNAQGQNVNDIVDSSSDMNSFTNTFESTLNDTFSTYTNVFGFGGYGSAPAPITFFILGRTYVLFDISTIGTNNIQLIRNTFLLFSYLFGFILVFRSV